ncbi:hypothetical protein GGTG_01687 [Gaeumannomyces tritici R3-111a-1]|uniref:Uncharacterized protein n=1 Tax=Gaeumannomyces tritici (strain R3-111a-1) TaxID=644352 RepID=J3NKA7_GAET3|nr:hypothetical protein GGTG_01687 [Gaeumannomyces tritici R3-111a-1]EJT81711.1 hypothetical protein GGTG_01687 [Gaeumannomyces tritici R3-111a-1]
MFLQIGFIFQLNRALKKLHKIYKIKIIYRIIKLVAKRFRKKLYSNTINERKISNSTLAIKAQFFNTKPNYIAFNTKFAVKHGIKAAKANCYLINTFFTAFTNIGTITAIAGSGTLFFATDRNGWNGRSGRGQTFKHKL